MSLNKFFSVDSGYDLKLDLGADEIKCNSLDVVGGITQDGKPVSDFQKIVANYTVTAGFAVPVPTGELGAFRSGNYVHLSDNVSVTADASGTQNKFTLEFDIPSYVPASGVERVMTMGNGGDDSPVLGYSVLKVQSTYVQGSGRLGLIFVKSDGTNFSAADNLNCSWQVVLNLNE